MPTIERQGVTLYYETHGAGRPFLFLSETACHCDVWKLHQVPEFSRGHQVILYDYRGTGRSTWPSGPYSVKDFADDAAAVLEHLDARDAVVCGHSMGGSVAQVMALDHSDRVSALICASGRAFNPTPGIPLRIAKEMVEWGYKQYLRDHGILVGFTDAFVKRYPHRVEGYLAVRLAHLNPVEQYFRHVIARQAHDVKERLKEIRMPTLILVGAEEHNVTSDTSLRQAADELAAGIPGAEFVELEGERHSYFFVNPDAAHAAIRKFLAG
ncbi:MAG: alpha/beta fold hydrolase [Deltaproteobacteria bacterium]|nr:alpha/beta fold hydrolase [Deltaproteobacteria bacterium]